MPVLVDVRSVLASSTRTACCEALSCDIVQSLLQFFVQNPGSFGAIPYLQQRSIARLISGQRKRLGESKAYLQTLGAPREDVDRLHRMISDASRDTEPCLPTDEAGLLSVLASVRVPGFDDYGLILDVSGRELSHYGMAALVPRLELILSMIPILTGARIILKVGLPDGVVSRLTLRSPVVSLRWSDDQLGKLLQRRLSWVKPTPPQKGSKPSWTEAFGPSVRNPEDQIIVAAKGSPRRLLYLSNQVLLRLGGKPENEPLTNDDLAFVFADSK